MLSPQTETELADAIRGAAHVATGRVRTAEAKLALLLVVATIPVMAAGLALKALGWDAALRSVEVIAWATIGFGLLLWAADRFGGQAREMGDWSWRDAVLIGLAQALALIPGTSRSGVTMTAARALGYDRVDGARIALLMSIPTIFAAGALVTKDLVEAENVALGLDALIAAGLSCVSALVALALMMRMLARWTMTPFVIYRLGLGAALLVWVYG